MTPIYKSYNLRFYSPLVRRLNASGYIIMILMESKEQTGAEADPGLSWLKCHGESDATGEGTRLKDLRVLKILS
jgi:hypothetical protein